jgi:hypothetical protein
VYPADGRTGRALDQAHDRDLAPAFSSEPGLKP